MQRRLDAIQHSLLHLTLPQQRTLALWGFGTQRARSHSLTLVSLLLAPLCKCHANAMRKRLKTWYAQTHRTKRPLKVQSCFAALLCWMTTDWSAPTLLLALDTTTIRNRWIILTVSVLYKKRAIPVAWRVLAWDKQAWNPIGKQLLSALAPAFPPGVRVLVLANRGLYSPELFEYIRQLGAHPAMRVNGDGGVLVEGSTKWQVLQELAPCPGTHWSGRCRVFKTNSLDCTVLALWAAGMQEAWIVLTDLPPWEASAVWYRYRSWSEQGFRDLKRLGWSCHRTLVRDAARLERVWLALAVATLWVLWYGTDEASARRVRGALWLRKRGVVSVFRRGWLLVWLEILACVDGLCCGWFPDLLEPVEDGGVGYEKKYPNQAVGFGSCGVEGCGGDEVLEVVYWACVMVLPIGLSHLGVSKSYHSMRDTRWVFCYSRGRGAGMLKMADFRALPAAGQRRPPFRSRLSFPTARAGWAGGQGVGQVPYGVGWCCLSSTPHRWGRGR